MKKLLSIFSILFITSCISYNSYESLQNNFDIKNIDLQITVKNDSIGGNPQFNKFLSREEISEILQKSLKEKFTETSNRKKDDIKLKISFDYNRCFVLFTSRFCGIYISNLAIYGYQDNKIIFSDRNPSKYTLKRNVDESIKYLFAIYSGKHTNKDEEEYIIALHNFLEKLIKNSRLKPKKNGLYKIKY
jgi:hypothetical protein